MPARGLRAGHVGFVDDDDVSQLQHRDFLQLQTRAVFGAHHEYRSVNESAGKGHCLLTNADGFDEDYVKAALDESLTGKPVTTSQTKPYGCSVKYKSS